jgi:hypothetical protein
MTHSFGEVFFGATGLLSLAPLLPVLLLLVLVLSLLLVLGSDFGELAAGLSFFAASL